MLESIPPACQKCLHIFEDDENQDYVQAMLNLAVSVPTANGQWHTFNRSQISHTFTASL